MKDISKLLSLQTSKHGHVRHVCFCCLNTFSSEKSLASHDDYCKSHEAIKIELPEERSKISLKITIGQCKAHLLYMLILNPLHHNCQPNPDNSYTKSVRNTSPADFLLSHKVF